MKTHVFTVLCVVTIVLAGAWTSAAGSSKVCNDFDGDGRTDPAVYCPASGTWYILQTSTYTIRIEHLGSGTCLPAPGDFDGDNKTDVVVFDSTTGIWYAKLSSGVDCVAVFGEPGSWPVPGDYDGDGITDLGVYKPETGIWSVLLSKYSYQLASMQWGWLGDFRPWEDPQTYTILPMPFDYNQDGTDDLAIYYRGWSMEDSGWVIFYVGVGVECYIWGSSGSLPVPGNYQIKLAEAPQGVCIYKITTTEWCIPYRSAFHMGVYGQTLPVPAGDYDGNGFDDNAVYNYDTGLWTIVLNTGEAGIEGRTEVSFKFGNDTVVPANIYSTLYALALYSPEPW